MNADKCVMCELQQQLRERSGEIRRELRIMHPKLDPNYKGLLQVLVDVDADYGALKERADA